MIAMNRDSQMPVLNRWGLEALMEHQEKMAVIRMRTQKRKQHKRKVMAAKKKVKRCLMYTCAVSPCLSALFMQSSMIHMSSQSQKKK